jgi:hypothetical protein
MSSWKKSPKTIFCLNAYITSTVEKSSQKFWATSAIFRNVSQSQPSSNLRKFVQSGHPGCVQPRKRTWCTSPMYIQILNCWSQFNFSGVRLACRTWNELFTSKVSIYKKWPTHLLSRTPDAALEFAKKSDVTYIHTYKHTLCTLIVLTFKS